VFAINKMDLAEYAQEVFTQIEQECHRFAAGRGSSDGAMCPGISTRGPKRQRTHAENGVVEPEPARLVEQRPRA
jgi:sulfate adenylyltransferase subunit 1 (EFTu-like GTPase family)